MEHLSRIRSLLIFLRSRNPSTDDILKFVCLDTLFEYSVDQVHLNIVNSDGTVNIHNGYGCDLELLELVPPRRVSADSPFNRYLRTGLVGDCGNFESFVFSGPGYAEKIFPNGFESSFSWPIPGVGAVATFCSRKITLTIQDEEFLLVIGSILSIVFERNCVRKLSTTRIKDSEFVADFALNKRQWQVLEQIIAGRTNIDIANVLSVSESLIRQETVIIYSKLGVSGRKEIQLRQNEFRQKAPSA